MYEPNGLFGNIDAKLDQRITNFYAEHGIPAGRSLGIVYVDYDKLHDWLTELEATYGKDSIYYPLLSSAKIVVERNKHTIALQIRLEDDARLNPDSFSRDPNSLYFPPTTLARAAQSFLTEMLWMGNGDLAAGEETYLSANDFDISTLTNEFHFAETMEELFHGSITQQNLQTYMLFVAHRIGRSAGRKYAVRNIYYKEFDKYPSIKSSSQDNGLRGVEHDFEDGKGNELTSSATVEQVRRLMSGNVNDFLIAMGLVSKYGEVELPDKIAEDMRNIANQAFYAGLTYSPS
jgi:hypothetical protein